MKSPIFFLIAAILTAPLTTMAATDRHDHGDAPHKIELNAGKKWTTDDPLRQAMNAIKSASVTMLPAAHAGKATDVDYDAFGKEVTAQVTYIVKNCKLDPKADAQLHTVIGDIMAGVEMSEGKQQGKKRSSGVVKVVQALNTYGKFFDHSGWKPVALPH
ncbi:MAG: hypothetical protein K2Q97_06705 [Burkholderiaceae bacterium]|nr:hypothetical protein [Burkholderiaceae bacterium]